MTNKMVRFLTSLNLENIDRFDMDFDLCVMNAYIKNQVDMLIVKKTPWEYSLLEEFMEGLNTIKYRYTLRFSYVQKPTAYDAAILFEDWHRSHNRFKANLDIETDGDRIIFVFKTEDEKEKFSQTIKDFEEFLKFFEYRFKFDQVVKETEKTAPNVSQKKLTKLTSIAREAIEADNAVEEAKETSYYKDNEDIADEQKEEELKIFEAQYIEKMKANLEAMKKERESGVKRNWRDKYPYQYIEDLSTITVDTGNVDINGELFGIDKPKTARNGVTFLTCGLGKGKSAVNIKIMENENITAAEIEGLKNNTFARIRGYTSEDRFTKGLVIQVRAIDLLPPPSLREDHSEQKRVELHLHTKLSVLDGVSTVKQYCQVAKNMGHKALAITDHGVVQAFPEAQDCQKEFGIKMLYGSELYMVNDELPFALNPKDIPLIGAKYVVFDLETTGLSTRYDRITEFGAICFENGQVVSEKDFFIDPEMLIPLKVQEKTKITQDMVNGKGNIEAHIDEILEYFKDAIIVSHNIDFDMGFINEALRRMGRPPLTNPAIDTLSLSRYMFPDAMIHRLGSLSRNLGITGYNEEEAHRANFDARILNEVWQAMLAKLTENNTKLLHSDLAKIKSTNAMLKHMRANHANVLVKNKNGLHDLYDLISKSHIDYLADVPKIPKRELSALRKDLLIGSACVNGEVFDAARTRSKQDLLDIMKFYDFIEVQPIANYSHLLDRGIVDSNEDIERILKDIISAADELGKPVVATGDVHYANPEDKITREIYIEAPAVGGKPHPLCNRDHVYDSPEQHYRSTDEMLKCFEFLGKEKAFEIVVTNTNMIADSIEELKPIQKELHPPVIENSPQILRDTCYKNAKELYGDPLPEVISNRLERELSGIIDNGYSVTYYIANRIIAKANAAGYMVGSRGSVGSSFAAHMFGITEVNPLPPHYRCPKCKHLEFVESDQYLSGYDLPDKKCPICGEKLVGDGQNIPFETFLGFNADKIPDIDLNFPSDYQQRAFDSTKEIFGEHNVFRAGTIETVADKTAFGYVRRYFEHKGIDPNTVSSAFVGYLASHCVDVKRTTGQHPGGIMVLPKGLSMYDFSPIQYPADDKESTWLTTHLPYTALHDALLKLDLLGHVDPLALRLMSEMTGIDVKKIPLNDAKVISLFTSDKALNRNGDYLKSDTGASGLPEFGTKTGQDILVDAKPKSFADLVAIAGLAHGTDVWNNNARDLIRSGQCTIREVIGCRDDIMTYLIKKGIPSDIAFKVMEDVRKGRKIKPEYDPVLRAHNVPDWYIDSCNKIKYMFPKAHAVAYVTMAVRVGWFKIYRPLEFYATWFTARAKAYDIEAMLGGLESMIKRYEEIKLKKQARKEKLTPKEENIAAMLIIAIEMAERGYKFKTVDLYRSHATEFVVDAEDGSLIPPFVVIDGLGEAAAESVVEARKEGNFTSKEDLLRRTKLSSTNVEDLSSIKALEGLGESDQMTLFEFGLDM